MGFAWKPDDGRPAGTPRPRSPGSGGTKRRRARHAYRRRRPGLPELSALGQLGRRGVRRADIDQATAEMGDWYQPARLARTRLLTIRGVSIRAPVARAGGAHAAPKSRPARRLTAQRTA